MPITGRINMAAREAFSNERHSTEWYYYPLQNVRLRLLNFKEMEVQHDYWARQNVFKNQANYADKY